MNKAEAIRLYGQETWDRIEAEKRARVEAEVMNELDNVDFASQAMLNEQYEQAMLNLKKKYGAHNSPPLAEVDAINRLYRAKGLRRIGG